MSWSNLQSHNSLLSVAKGLILYKSTAFNSSQLAVYPNKCTGQTNINDIRATEAESMSLFSAFLILVDVIPANILQRKM